MPVPKLHTKKIFREAHRTLFDDEYERLEAEILADGMIRDSVVVMQGDVIVDGHHRYKIAKKHNLNVPIVIKTFESDEDAVQWILRLQLARRNLNSLDFKLTMGKLYNVTKKDVGDFSPSVGQNDPPRENSDSTAEKIGEKAGVSASTVKRTAKFEEAFDKLSDAIKNAIKKKPSIATQAAVFKMAGMTKSDLIPIARAVRVGDHPTFDHALGLKKVKPKPAPKKGGGTKKKAAPKKKAGREVESAKSLFRDLQKHVGILVRGIDAMAKANGGKGAKHKKANDSLNTLIGAMKEMREGKK